MAGVTMTRPRSARPFDADDAARLDGLRPWIAHALRARGAVAVEKNAAGEPAFAAVGLARATAIVAIDGTILCGSPGTNYLMYLCQGLTDDLSPLSSARLRTAPPIVRKVVRQLLATTSEDWAAPPRAARATPWGRLVIEASWMVSAEDDLTDIGREAGGSPIAVTLELREHAAAYAARVLRQGGASASQVRIGTMLALGRTKPQIAAELGLKLSSVTDATRKLYDRLDVHNAAQLGRMLWTE